MKTELTKEESQHLLDLGVPKEKASGTFKVFDDDDTLFYTQPIFKLEDFLNGEILPKEIEVDKSPYDEICYYVLMMHPLGKQWEVSYYDDDNVDYLFGGIRTHEEPINALYQLTCWYYGEYLKSEEI